MSRDVGKPLDRIPGACRERTYSKLNHLELFGFSLAQGMHLHWTHAATIHNINPIGHVGTVAAFVDGTGRMARPGRKARNVE